MTHSTDELHALSAVDRAFLALDDLHHRWKSAERTFTVEMFADTAADWVVEGESTDALASFLAAYVMESVNHEHNHDCD